MGHCSAARTERHWASAPSSDSERQLAGLLPRMPRMRSQECRAAVSFPLLFLPQRENRIFPVQGSPSPAPLWESRGHVGSAAALGWALNAGEPGGWGWASTAGDSRSVWVLHVLRTYYVLSSYSRNLTSMGDCFTGQTVEAQRGQGTCPRAPAGKWQSQA